MEKIIFAITILFLGFNSKIATKNNTRSYEDLSSQIIAAATESDIICLGEHSHADMSAIKMKARVLKDIVSEVPTGAILFEAPLVSSVIAYIKNEFYSEFVWPFWRYESLKVTLDSNIDTSELICLGFDPQETCNFSRFTSFLVSEGYLENDVELSIMDSILSFAISDGSSNKMRKLTHSEVEIVKETIEIIKLKLHWPSGISKTEKALISLCFENRKHLAMEMSFNKIKDQMNFRDSIMALNLKDFTEILKPSLKQKKVIIWAANIHIAKKVNKGTWMMERFIEDNLDKVLSIGFRPRRQIIRSQKFDFTVVSGKPEYMPQEIFFYYDCEVSPTDEN